MKFWDVACSTRWCFWLRRTILRFRSKARTKACKLQLCQVGLEFFVSFCFLVVVCAGPKIQLRLGRKSKFRQPIACKLVRDLVAIAQMKLDMQSEKSLLEAAKLEFVAAAATVVSAKDRKATNALFGLTEDLDAEFVQVWHRKSEEE